MVTVRAAETRDADAAVDVVRRSITERRDFTLLPSPTRSTPRHRPGVARDFYEALGYVPGGSAKPHFGVLQCYPYRKILQPDCGSSGREEV